jgi:hypothetical protein
VNKKRLILCQEADFLNCILRAIADLAKKKEIDPAVQKITN